MLKKRIAWILAAAMIITSVGSAGMKAQAAETVQMEEMQAVMPEGEAGETPVEDAGEETGTTEETAVTKEISETEEVAETEALETEMKQETEKKDAPDEIIIEEEPGKETANEKSARAAAEGKEPSDIVPDGEVKLGKNVVNSPIEGEAYYTLVITESGNYSFQSENYSERYLYNEKNMGYAYNVSPSKAAVVLEAGTYYLQCSGGMQGYDENNEWITASKYQLTITKAPTVTAVEADFSKAECFIQGLELDFNSKVKLKISYSYGEAQIISLQDGYDSYGNGISQAWGMDSEMSEYIYSGNMEAGKTYYVEYTLGGIPTSPRAVKVLSPEEAITDEVVVGDNTVKSPIDGGALYKLHISEAGKYCFKSENYSGRVLYSGEKLRNDSDVSGWWNTVDLEPGTCYLRCAGGMENDKDEIVEEYQLTILKVPEITELEIIPGKTKYPENQEWYECLRDWSFRINYNDNTKSKELKLYNRDAFGNSVQLQKLINMDTGEELFEGKVPAGNYDAVFECGEMILKSGLIQFLPAEEVGKEIVIGSQVLEDTGDGKLFYYFQAPEYGKYRFHVVKGEGEVERGEEYSNWNPDEPSDVVLEKDEVMFFEWTSISGALLEVFKVKKVTGIETANGIKELEFVYPPFDSEEELRYFITPENLAFKLTYDDKSTETVVMEEYDATDSYGNHLDWNLYAGLGIEMPIEKGEYIEPGNYFMQFYCGDTELMVPISVKTFQSVEKVKVKEGKNQISNSKEFYGEFTPSVSGKYAFHFSTLASMSILSEQGEVEVSDVDTSYDYHAILDKGVPYQIYVNTGDSYKNYELTIEKALEVKDIRLTLMRSQYIAGMESPEADDYQVTLTYSDGSEATVRGDKSDAYGNRFRYEVTKGASVVDLADGLNIGKYTVKAYLCTGSVVSKPQEFEGISASASEYEMVEEDQLIEVVGSKTGNFYRFTPKTTDKYLLKPVEAWGEYSIQFFEETESGIKRASEKLEQGKEYIAVLYSKSTLQGRILSESQYRKETETKFIDGGSLTLDATKEGKIDEDNTKVVYTFTPEESGEYQCQLSSSGGVHIDILENGEFLDGGETFLTTSLIKGKTYQYKVELFMGSGTFQIRMVKCQNKEISSIELKLLSDKNFSIINKDEVLNELTANITYSDGTTEKIHETDYVLIDKYGMEYYLREDELIAKETDEYYIYRYSIRSEADASIKGQLDVRIAKIDPTIPILEQGEEAVHGSLAKNTVNYYYFTPKESGGYKLVISNSTGWIYSTILDEEEIRGNIYQLDAGKTYVICLSTDGDEEELNYDVSINKTELKDVSGIKIVSPPDQTYIYHKWQMPSLSGFKVEVFYSDGTSEILDYTQDLSMNVADQYGNYFDMYTSILNSKKEQLTFGFDGYRVTQDIELRSLTEVQKELKTGNGSVQFGKNSVSEVFRVVPQTGGFYSFAFMRSKGYVNGGLLVDEAGDEISVFSGMEEEKIEWQLQQGKVYYVIIDYEEQDTDTELNYQLTETEHTHRKADSDKGNILKEATCTEDGQIQYTCVVCHEKYVEVIKASGHKMAASSVKAPTCTEEGYTIWKCQKCGETEIRDRKPMLAHTYGAYVVRKEATALAAGEKVRKCTMCGREERASIAKLSPVLKLNATSISLKVKQSTTKVKVTQMAKGDKILSWKSDKPKIATVSSKGKITGKKVGTAKITVTLQSGKKAVVKVKVQKSKVVTKSLKIQKKNLTLARRKSYTLLATLSPITSTDKISYTSSNKKVATVSKKGKITAKKKGKAVITVKAGKKKVTCKVTVK